MSCKKLNKSLIIMDIFADLAYNLYEYIYSLWQLFLISFPFCLSHLFRFTFQSSKTNTAEKDFSCSTAPSCISHRPSSQEIQLHLDSLRSCEWLLLKPDFLYHCLWEVEKKKRVDYLFDPGSAFLVFSFTIKMVMAALKLIYS